MCENWSTCSNISKWVTPTNHYKINFVQLLVCIFLLYRLIFFISLCNRQYKFRNVFALVYICIVIKNVCFSWSAFHSQNFPHFAWANRVLKCLLQSGKWKIMLSSASSYGGYPGTRPTLISSKAVHLTPQNVVLHSRSFLSRTFCLKPPQQP